MVFLTDKSEIEKLYTKAVDEARVRKKDYPEFERLADNDLLPDLDENLPETNDGSLSAALFKLPKRIINSKLTGRVKSDSDEAWISEVANMQLEKRILKKAKTQAEPYRKNKDAVRKAAIYGSVPIINIFVEHDDGTYGADYYIAQPQDVYLEPGKVSDIDSHIIFYDVYYSDHQLDQLIEQAELEAKEPDTDGYSKWNIEALKQIKESKQKTQRSTENIPEGRLGLGITEEGYKFYVAVQRGVQAPFYMCHAQSNEFVREWSNDDPTGDVPVHYLYCYQDFINPYGIGIVKLAGGTQNVLDYMRQADVLATQLGFRPPILISGDTDGLDIDSFIYAQDQPWIAGKATVQRQEISNQVYSQLPGRMEMYLSSLNKLLPMGDTSVSAGAGDPMQSKTPAGVKFAQANLSIDDDDFKDNFYKTWEAVVTSLINIEFANLNGAELMKVTDEEREILAKAGIEFPTDENGDPTNEFEYMWDQARSTFTYEVEAVADDSALNQEKREGLLSVAELRASDPEFDMKLQASGYRIDDGELYSEIIKLSTDNDKILVEISPEELDMMNQQAEEQAMMEQQAMEAEAMQPEVPMEQPMQPIEGEVVPPYDMTQDPEIELVRQEALSLGMSPDEVEQAIQMAMGGLNA